MKITLMQGAVLAGMIFAVSFLAAYYSLGALALIGVFAIIIIVAFRPHLMLPSMTVAALVLTRPNIWGAHLSEVGVLLLFLASLGVFFISGARGKNLITNYALYAPPILMLCAYGWSLGQSSYFGDGAHYSIIVGGVLMVLALASICIVCARPYFARDVLRAFVATCIVFCVSYILTVFFWLLGGIGYGMLGYVPAAGYGNPVPLYFPFTPTASSQQVFGLTVPRFVGFGREPGWMAFWASAAFVLYKFTGWRRLWPLPVLFIGVLGTLSTAGFVLLIPVLALQFFSSHGLRGAPKRVLRAIRWTLGAIFIFLGVYMAVYAPILGLAAKGSQNAISLEQRSVATERGLDALVTGQFFGGPATEALGAVNLLAAIATKGLPWVLIISLAVIVPLWFHPRRLELIPFLALAWGTLAFAQPANDSIWVFCLIIVAASAAYPSSPGRSPRVQRRLVVQDTRT